MEHRPATTDLAAARALFSGLATGERERVAIAYLDPKRRILGMRHGIGGLNQAALSIRQVSRDALGFDASALIIAHTHPSGDPTPSDRDIAFTIALATALRALDMVLVDHLVIAGDRVVSLRERGVI